MAVLGLMIHKKRLVTGLSRNICDSVQGLSSGVSEALSPLSVVFQIYCRNSLRILPLL